MAGIPLLLGAAYLTKGQVLELGPAHFDVIRILISVGVLRVMVRGESIAGGMNNLDRTIIFWALWLISSSAFHTANAWVYRAGIVWTDLGCYFLLRIFIQNDEAVKLMFKALCVLLIPVSILMIFEHLYGKNYIAALGGENIIPNFREGRFRAKGSFAHAIFAGTVGAGCFAMALYLWKSHRTLSILGLLSTGGMVFASTSSGPIMMVIFIAMGLLLWHIRSWLPTIRWLALGAVIVLDMVMKAPFYFLMARIDLSGGSKGWHRAQLIRTSIAHLDEWWLTGTDYTRHWMATGIPANDQHIDVTNHLLTMGINGGLPLLFIFCMMLVIAFNSVGRTLRQHNDAPTEHGFLIWTLGAILFGHVWNFFSISYFDQSIVFFYLILASIGAVRLKPSSAYMAPQTLAQRVRYSRYVVKPQKTVNVTPQKIKAEFQQ